MILGGGSQVVWVWVSPNKDWRHIRLPEMERLFGNASQIHRPSLYNLTFIGFYRYSAIGASRLEIFRVMALIS